MKMHRDLLTSFKQGEITMEEFLDFEEQYFLLKNNWNNLLSLYPGKKVAYCGGKEYVAETDLEIWDKIEIDDPKKKRKICSALIPGVNFYETW